MYKIVWQLHAVTPSFPGDLFNGITIILFKTDEIKVVSLQLHPLMCK